MQFNSAFIAVLMIPVLEVHKGIDSKLGTVLFPYCGLPVVYPFLSVQRALFCFFFLLCVNQAGAILNLRRLG